MQYAHDNILDSVWVLGYDENEDGSITIHVHDRDKWPEGMSYEDIMRTPCYDIVEGSNRVAYQVKFGPNRNNLNKVVAVANPHHVFSYKKL
jgi:hypothetical protein